MKARSVISRSGLLACALALAACQTVQTTQPGAVGVERKQSMLLSASDVDKSASLAYQQELKKAASKNLLNRDAAQVARVRVMALRLDVACPIIGCDG